MRQSIYQEEEGAGEPFRVAYQKGIKELIESRKKECERIRSTYGASIAQNREQMRARYLDMLGWPLNERPAPVINVREIPVFENPEYRITRLQLEIFQDFWFYGILMQHKGVAGPLVVSQHGGEGTPEMCGSFFNSENYNDMSVRLFHQGAHVFAPQTLLWKTGRFGPDNMRNELDNALKQLGGSIAALEIYCISRCLDYFETQPYTNGAFGMAGLSYGGFYTLYTAAADTRIRAALACSHFNDRTVYNWHDKVWKGAACTFLDAEVGALVCPRYLFIEVGDEDELFDFRLAQREYERLKGYYMETPENLAFHVFHGVHEFCPEDDAIIAFVQKLK